MQISAPHPAPESTKLDWGPATWVFTGLQVILLLPMLENRCFTFFAISRVTLPSLVCQQCFLWPTEFSTFPSSIPSSAMELCGHKGPFSPVCVDRTLPPHHSCSGHGWRLHSPSPRGSLGLPRSHCPLLGRGRCSAWSGLGASRRRPGAAGPRLPLSPAWRVRCVCYIHLVQETEVRTYQKLG